MSLIAGFGFTGLLGRSQRFSDRAASRSRQRWIWAAGQRFLSLSASALSQQFGKGSIETQWNSVNKY